MGIADRKSRERAGREQRITTTARMIAEGEGWSAVTVRRLADEIEYSQPVLYAHFENRDAIVAAVAIEGFRELALALRQAAHGSTVPQEAALNVARAYLAFALAQPALYEAMFAMPTGLRFAEADTRAELKDCFAALAAVVAPSGSDVGLATETFWAALHGLVALEQAGRIRPDMRDARATLVVRGLLEC